eukprot:TRINITY_DN8233_c0_g1_i1.p1 TRINITY_DN8233_c0_g1~~TRINITY_DN8233_c0_g1_i1.p1  ORF type:complete len:461 (+),score=102.73 TRINITY_DN8233_c0_g1_i1:580-1962(+)
MQLQAQHLGVLRKRSRGKLGIWTWKEYLACVQGDSFAYFNTTDHKLEQPRARWTLSPHNVELELDQEPAGFTIVLVKSRKPRRITEPFHFSSVLQGADGAADAKVWYERLMNALYDVEVCLPERLFTPAELTAVAQQQVLDSLQRHQGSLSQELASMQAATQRAVQAISGIQNEKECLQQKLVAVVCTSPRKRAPLPAKEPSPTTDELLHSESPAELSIGKERAWAQEACELERELERLKGVESELLRGLEARCEQWQAGHGRQSGHRSEEGLMSAHVEELALLADQAVAGSWTSVAMESKQRGIMAPFDQVVRQSVARLSDATAALNRSSFHTGVSFTERLLLAQTRAVGLNFCEAHRKLNAVHQQILESGSSRNLYRVVAQPGQLRPLAAANVDDHSFQVCCPEQTGYGTVVHVVETRSSEDGTGDFARIHNELGSQGGWLRTTIDGDINLEKVITMR